MNNKCIFLCESDNNVYDVFGTELMSQLSSTGTIYKKENIINPYEDFTQVEYIFSTWGMPAFSEDEIKTNLPSLKAVFYGAGSVQGFAKEFLNCGVRVFSAWQANAIPVTEYTLAQILLASKGYYQLTMEQSCGKLSAAEAIKHKFPGNFGTAVGIIGVGMIGRGVIELLRQFDLDVYAYDAFLPQEEVEALGAKKVSLTELFANCLIVSNHLANNPATVGMLNYELFKQMMPYSTFINTGRGAQVVEDDLVKHLTERPDVTALLDVTYPEPPCEGHEFYKLKNCFLTPHIAGSMGNEVRRMGKYMHDAYIAILADEKCNCEVSLEMLKTMA